MYRLSCTVDVFTAHTRADNMSDDPAERMKDRRHTQLSAALFVFAGSCWSPNLLIICCLYKEIPTKASTDTVIPRPADYFTENANDGRSARSLKGACETFNNAAL